MDLVDKIRLGAFVQIQLPWPGTDEPVFLRVLSKAEQQEATFAADHHFRAKNIPVAAHTIEAYKDEETVQILWRALSTADGKRIQPTVDAFRGILSTDVQTALAQAYAVHESEVAPDPEKMSDEDYEKFLEDLKKKPEAMLGSVSSIAFARRLLRSLVAQLPS